LPGVALPRGKNHCVLPVELLRRQPAGRREGNARELRERLEHLADCVLVALREDGHLAQPVLVEQELTAAGVVKDVDDLDVDSVFRKKLFRSEAAASPRLGEVQVLIRGDFHSSLR
jgi:hypothetical protein